MSELERWAHNAAPSEYGVRQARADLRSLLAAIDLPPCAYKGCGKPEDDRSVHPVDGERLPSGGHVYRWRNA